MNNGYSRIRFTDSDEAIAHYGILGMKWGERRFQNPDGTLTEAGRQVASQNQATLDRIDELLKGL